MKKSLKESLLFLVFLCLVSYFVFDKYVTSRFFVSLIRQRQMAIAKVVLFLKPSVIKSNGEERYIPALHLACYLGDQSLVKLIIEAGGNLEEISHFNAGFTPLHAVVFNNNLELFKFLLYSYKVNLNVLSESGETLLMIAVQFNNTEMLKYLLKLGAKPNKGDRGNVYPIHLTGVTGNLEIAKILVNFGAEPKVQTIFNSSPLHYAAKRGHFDLIKFFVSKGCDPHQAQKDGKTPINIASDEEFTQIVDYLKNPK